MRGSLLRLGFGARVIAGFLGGLVAVAATVFAGTLDAPRLQLDLDRLARTVDGRVGACVADASVTVCVNGDQRSSLQSVMKLVAAAAVLEQVDAGRWKLDEAVTVRREDLSVGVQPVAELVGRDGFRTTLGDLVRRAIVDSDSACADMLLARLGGPKGAQDFLEAHHVVGMRIDRDERHLQTESMGLEWRPELVDPKALNRALDACRRAGETRPTGPTRPIPATLPVPAAWSRSCNCWPKAGCSRPSPPSTCSRC